MIFPLKQVINFAITRPAEVDKAYQQFFGQLPFSELKTEWEELFLEWLVFDFRPSSGISFLVEYTLRNPDNLGEEKINQFKQIAKTHFYSQFEILKVKRGEWIRVENLFDGKVYKVYEKKGSETLPGKGLIPARVANVDGKWYFVGANSIFYPLTHTERAKKHLWSLKIKKYSPKDTVDLLRAREENPPEPVQIPTAKELKEKHISLEKEYKELAQKHHSTLPFDRLISAIYREERVNVLDFWTELENKGLKTEMLMENVGLFQDIWNYFPHKCLNNLSPIEAFKKIKKR